MAAKAQKKSSPVKVQDNLVGISMNNVGQDKILSLLNEMGDHPKVRVYMTEILRMMESDISLPINRSLREEFTGPMTDALYKDAGVLQKTLKDGTIYNFIYRSKIARDLILSPDPEPDHVFEPQTTKLFLHLAKKKKHVVIGGAYSGDHAILGAKVVARNNGVIHGFEPSDEERALLTRNARENGVAKNVKAVSLGLWDKNITLELVGDDAFAHAEPLRGKANKGAITFPATSIDAYAKKNKINEIGLILMDIEGSEFPALKGALSFLQQPMGKAPDIIFEVHRYYVDWSKKGLAHTEIITFLRKLGYSVFAIRDFQSNVPMKGCKIELIKPEDVYLKGPPHGFNMLAVKDPRTVQHSLFRMVKNVSPKLLLHKDPALHWPQEWR